MSNSKERKKWTSKEVAQIFNEIQLSTATHKKQALKLKKCLEDDENRPVLETIKKYINVSFHRKIDAKDLYVDRIISFFVELAAAHNDATLDGVMSPILEEIFVHILELCTLAHEGYRYWGCKALGKILRQLDNISQELSDKITEIMMQRLNESKVQIRHEAILVLVPLQNPAYSQDPVIESFLRLVNNDCNSKIRQLIMQKLAKSVIVVPYVIQGLRDMNDNVRIAAFTWLQTVPFNISLTQRRTVLKNAFLEKAPKVKHYITSVLLPSWLTAFGHNFLKLFSSIRLDACEDDIREYVLLSTQLMEFFLPKLSKEEIMEHLQFNEKKLIPFDLLNWESVLYYRLVVDFCRKSDDYSYCLENILPDVVDLCSHIKEFIEEKKEDENYCILKLNFIAQELLLVMKGCDVGDNISRHALCCLLYWILQRNDLSEDLAKVAIENVWKVRSNVHDASLLICEMVSNIFEGDDEIDYDYIAKKEVEKSLRISQIKAEISSLLEQEQEFVALKHFEEAKRCAYEINDKRELLRLEEVVEVHETSFEERQGSRNYAKALHLAIAFLRSPRVNTYTSAIAALNKQVCNLLLHPDRRVKLKAFECYGLISLLDVKCASYVMNMLSMMICPNSNVESNLLVICLKIVTDLLCLHGSSLVEEDILSLSIREEEKKVFTGGIDLNDLLRSIAEQLNDTDIAVARTATECACTLLLSSSITSSSLLTAILIKWLNPITENQLKQFIGYTLYELPNLAKEVHYFADAFISTIKCINQAPARSPLIEVNIEKIVKFMVAFCSMSPEESPIIEELLEKLCDTMIRTYSNKHNMNYLKLLLAINIPKKLSNRELLVELCAKLKRKFREKQMLKGIESFSEQLGKVDETMVNRKSSSSGSDSENDIEQ